MALNGDAVKGAGILKANSRKYLIRFGNERLKTEGILTVGR